MNEQHILEVAEGRWMFDAVHHAKVETIAQITNKAKQSRIGQDLTSDEWALARHVASLALVTQEHFSHWDPEDWVCHGEAMR